jgi:predicted acetyltransferase
MILESVLMNIPFLHSDCTSGSVVDLIEDGKEAPSSQNLYAGSVYYEICLHRQRMKIGECDLRIGMNDELYYAGNIGYRIFDGWRGHHYAYEACLLLFRIAKEKYHMNTLIITCSPENTASKKTLERLGGTLVETVNVPEWHWLCRRGERVKEIYSFKL